MAESAWAAKRRAILAEAMRNHGEKLTEIAGDPVRAINALRAMHQEIVRLRQGQTPTEGTDHDA